MSTIKRFEDLECWQEARKLVNSEAKFEEIYDKALNTIKIIDGLLRYLRSRRSEPSKRT